MKTHRLVSITCLLATALANRAAFAADHSSVNNSNDRINYSHAPDAFVNEDGRKSLAATRWAEVFKRLTNSNNISVLISDGYATHHIDRVVTAEADTRFLVLRSQDDAGGYFTSIVDADTVIVIQENPRKSVTNSKSQ